MYSIWYSSAQIKVSLHIGDRLITSGYSLSGRLFPCWRKARLLAGAAFPGPARTANSQACTCSGITSTLTSYGAILSKLYSIMTIEPEKPKPEDICLRQEKGRLGVDPLAGGCRSRGLGFRWRPRSKLQWRGGGNTTRLGRVCTRGSVSTWKSGPRCSTWPLVYLSREKWDGGQ